jgi:hypothetical protein
MDAVKKVACNFMTTDPNHYINLIALFRVGLTHELISQDDISSWAEKIINNDTVPDSFIIDLFFASQKDINETITLIDNFVYNKDHSLLKRVLFSLMYRNYIENKIELNKVLSSINWLHTQTDISNY